MSQIDYPLSNIGKPLHVARKSNGDVLVIVPNSDGSVAVTEYRGEFVQALVDGLASVGCRPKAVPA